MEIRYDMKIKDKDEFQKFIKWANKNYLKWESGRKIVESDWESVNNRICVFWFIHKKYCGFETCGSVTYNCKNIVHYVSTNFCDFLKFK